MAYISLYRKYRSQTFSDLIGQDHVVRTLQNGVSSGKIAHSYLFTGPRGTGKTSSARLLAKCLNCEKGPTPEPCNVCEQCKAITLGNCVDVYEIDAASESGVDNVRETIVEAVQYVPNFCRFKIFIIDEVHDLSPKAFDALLKTIEEPPEYVIFILATTEYNKVPPTIRSRCQKYEFHRASLQNLVDRLTYVITSEGGEAEPSALTAIARMADGGYRDALTLLEQALLTSEGKITLHHVYDQLGLVSEETVDGILIAMRNANIPAVLDHLNDVARRGRDPRAVLESMMYRLSDLTRAAYSVDSSSADGTRDATLFETASHVGRENLLWLRGAIAEAHKSIRDVSLPRIWLEAELIRIATTGASQAAGKASQVEPPKVSATVKAEPPIAASASESKPKPAKEPPEAAPPAEQLAVIESTAPATTQPAPSRSTGDPQEIWMAALADLPPTTAIAMKLADSKYIAFKDGTLQIAVLSIHLNWFGENPKRLAHISQNVQKHAGQPWKVEFVANKNGAAPSIAEPEAVELPVEGEPLHKLASEILGQNGNSK